MLFSLKFEVALNISAMDLSHRKANLLSSGLPGHEATENSGNSLRSNTERAAAANQASDQLGGWNAVRRSLAAVDLRRAGWVSMATP
ncbi:hypothetical protein GUJ93_ZPchr0013g37681 [Zizania palustris]|uniref:Uncharacterized protein n=1 Tax=Zizania palustris TaxID=103762 RepID=A0A8J6BWU8_ZIZPA|nr:hypothetical protein GUJ93_ZPchr0013g37681 [Zizania palustris]